MTVGVSRLQESEIPLRGVAGASHVTVAVVKVTHFNERTRVYLEVMPRDPLRTAYGRSMAPEEAYSLGQALIEQAKECGYDEDTGETKRVV